MSQAHDWRTAPAAELIAHILWRYHQRHREQLPELINQARRVEQVHSTHRQCPNGLAEHLQAMQQELESHMCKEEHVLFPLLQQGLGQHAAAPIRVMRLEHDEHGQALQTLLALTDTFTPPADACNTWRALYQGLQVFHDDLVEHIQLENEVLFS